MESQSDKAIQTLYGAGGISVSNIGLFPGTAAGVGPEVVAKEVNRVLAQLESGDYEVVSV